MGGGGEGVDGEVERAGDGERGSERDGAILVEGDRVAGLGGDDGGAQGAGARVGAGGDMAGEGRGMEDAGEEEGGESQGQDKADQREPSQTSAHVTPLPDPPHHAPPRRQASPESTFPLPDAVIVPVHRHKCKCPARERRNSVTAPGRGHHHMREIWRCIHGFRRAMHRAVFPLAGAEGEAGGG